MTAVELQEEKPRSRGDLEDRFHGLRLEVEKVRTDLAKVETRLVEKIGKVEATLVGKIAESETRMGGKIGEVETRMGELEVRMVEKIGESEARMGGKMGEVEVRLSDRIDGAERTLRGWLVIGVSLIGALIALVELLGQ